MTKQEMLDYLLSTGLFDKGTKNHPYAGLYYEEMMIDTDKTIPISELVKRFIEVDKEYNGRPWNLLQILSNINMIVPVEDRKGNDATDVAAINKETEDILYRTIFTDGKMMLSPEIDSCDFHAMNHNDTEILGMFLDVFRLSNAEDLKRILIKGYIAWMKEK